MSFKPPQSAINNAKRGLKLRQEWGRGGLSPAEAKAQGIDSGVTRARKIASGTVSEHDVRRMSAFNRHRKNYRPDKKMPDGGPTAGTIAWLLWGGTSGVNWAKKKSAAMNAEDFEAETIDYTQENCHVCGTHEDYESMQFCALCKKMFCRKRCWGSCKCGSCKAYICEECDEEGCPPPPKPKKRRWMQDYDWGSIGAENFEAEDPDDPELLDYMVIVPVLHYYTVGPVEAYNREDAEDEVVDNWRYWRSTIDNNGDWGGPIWRYHGIDISEPEAYVPTKYEAEYKTMRKDEIGQLVSATKACLDALNDCLEDDGRFNMDEYDALWATHPILADLESKRFQAEYKTVPQDLFNQLVAGLRAAMEVLWEAMDEWEHNGRFDDRDYNSLIEEHPIVLEVMKKTGKSWSPPASSFEASGLTMPAGFQETDDYYSDDGAHIITAEIPFLAPKGYYISDMEFHDGHIEVIFISEDNKTFDADWRDLPRDSKGRWMSKEQPSLSPKVSTYSRSMITLRDLTEQLQESLGLTDFNSAYFTVQQMLDAFPGGDSDEARRALRNTIEDTRMVLEYDEAIDYPTHIQIMADIYRESGDVPPEQYEEAVFNRIAFEDEFAAERRVKPNLPVPSPDYTYSETFGKNIVLLSEDDEEEGPTVEDFFRDVEKLFNKYGEFSWDSEQHDDGLAINCFLVPWNGAYNFFQYDEDFSQYRDE